MQKEIDSAMLSAFEAVQAQLQDSRSLEEARYQIGQMVEIARMSLELEEKKSGISSLSFFLIKSRG
jgi:hypothetical protein